MVDAVAGELGGQGEVESPFLSLSPTAVGGGKGGFGFPHAHGCLDDVEAGLVGEGDESFLKRAWGELGFGGLCKQPGKREGWHDCAAMPADEFQCRSRAGSGGVWGVVIAEWLLWMEWKPVCIRADPVAKSDEAGEPMDAGAGLDRFGRERAEIFHKLGEEFAAEWVWPWEIEFQIRDVISYFWCRVAAVMAACAESPSERDFPRVLEFWERGEEGLADEGVISAGALGSVDIRKLAQGTFFEKTGRDFPDVVGGGEGDGSCWRKISACLR